MLNEALTATPLRSQQGFAPHSRSQASTGHSLRRVRGPTIRSTDDPAAERAVAGEIARAGLENSVLSSSGCVPSVRHSRAYQHKSPKTRFCGKRNRSMEVRN
jgi:hypothetical protein